MNSPTFTLFPSLHRELRLLIWTFTLPISRRIDLDLSKIPNPPLTLFTNRESRSLTLEHYEWVPVLRCYIDFSIDLFNYNLLSSFRDLTPKAENLVFSFTSLESPSFEHYIRGQLRRLDVESFPRLKKMLVVGHYFRYTEVWGPTQAQEGKPTRKRVYDSLEGMREIAEEKLQEVRKGESYAMDEVASQAPSVSFEVCEKCFKDFEEGVLGMGSICRY